MSTVLLAKIVCNDCGQASEALEGRPNEVRRRLHSLGWRRRGAYLARIEGIGVDIVDG